MYQKSSSIQAFFWWSGYAVAAIWAQTMLSGVDFLVPGLVLSLQERPGTETGVVALCWVLLQEGMGNMAFGYALMWYGVLVLAYLAGQWLFKARSFPFMCLLGIGLGVLHPLLVSSLASLQGLAWVATVTMWEGLYQALAFPLVWYVARTMLPRGMRFDDSPV